MSLQFLEATIAIHLVYTTKEGIPLLQIVPYWVGYRFLCCHEYQEKFLSFLQSVPRQQRYCYIPCYCNNLLSQTLFIQSRCYKYNNNYLNVHQQGCIYFSYHKHVLYEHSWLAFDSIKFDSPIHIVINQLVYSLAIQKLQHSKCGI